MTNRFWQKVNKTSSCWFWTGTLDGYGYGVFKCKGKYYKAHRIAYDLLIRHLTPSEHLHHLCSHRNCVNPQHVIPVTRAEHNAIHFKGKEGHKCSDGCRCNKHTPKKVYCKPGCTCRRHTWGIERALRRQM